MTSKQMRENPLFMRNNYNVDGKWGLPLVKNQKFDTDSRKKVNDKDENKKSGVHFFVDDYRFKGIYDNPEKH